MTIHHRLLSGYALILGLAVAGTTMGLIIGNRHQRHALEFRQAAAAEHTLLNEIQIGILYNRPAKQLSPHLNDPVRFRAESQKFLNRVQAVQSLMAPHKALHQTMMHSGTGNNHRNMANIESLHRFLDQSEVTVQQFYDRTRAFISTIDALGYTPVTLDLAQKEVLAFAQSDEFQSFIGLSDQLEPFVEQVKQREEEATQALQQAERLRTSLVLGSLLVSTAIATLVGLLTSQTISRPLKSVTDIAQRVTENHNFNIQVPVERNDEIGILATSLNQLIQRVNQLLTELKQKNVDVNEALDQLQRQQAQLVQSEKMSSLGQLVAGVAHEINNPVNFIHGNLAHVNDYTDDLLHIIDLYQEQCPQPSDAFQAAIEECDLEFIQDDLPKTLKSMSIGTHRIREIVLSLRNFARMDEAELKPAEIHDGLNNTLLLLQHRIKSTPKRPEIDIIRHYGEIPPIECYAGLLNQVFMNILANAIDALEDKRLQAKVPAHDDDRPHIRIQTSLVRGKDGDGLWVKIAIADNGLGMSADTQKRVFDPFFTTKPIGKGTGMGMSICYQIVHDRHEGQIECHSTLGEGTEFVIQIPIHPTIPTDSPWELVGHPPVKPTETTRAIAR